MKKLKMRKNKKELKTFNAAFDFSLTKLSYRDHSKIELENKLRQNGATSEIIDAVINKLLEYSYLNEERFGESIFNSWQLKGTHGINALKLKFKKRFIEDSVAQKYIDSCDYDLEVKNAINLIKKYLKKNTKKYNLTDIKAKNAIKRGLIYRGFTFDTINRAFEEVKNMDDLECNE
jgi:regulatory protein